MATGVCRLCGQTRDLRDSHIVPKFVFDWMKQTGGTHFRVSGTPNRRVQDGRKYPLLCEECEQRFSGKEKWFSENIFDPYIGRGVKSLPYDGSLFYFLVSVLWRALQDEWAEVPPGHPFRARLELAEQEWRTFLLGGPVPPTFNDLHLFLTDVSVQEDSQPVVNFNRYFARAVDHTIASSQRQCFVYAKFARFIAFAGVGGLDPALLIGTKIYPAGSTLTLPQEMRDGGVGEFMLDRARTLNEMIALGTSQKQKSVVTEAFRKQAEKILKSDLGAVIAADYGTEVDPLSLWPEPGADDNCPCGSGKKFKDCHGK
jgi:hypothetical protein